MDNNINNTELLSKGQAVLNLYWELKKKSPSKTIAQLAEVIYNSPAPKFFCTFENARRVVSQLHRGLKVRVSNPNTLAMYKEIYRRWLEKDIEDKVKNRFETLYDIIHGEAPSFYASKTTIISYITQSTIRGGKRGY